MKKRYLIIAPSFDENNGGCIVQHKLCSIISEQGYECYLYPNFTEYFAISARPFNLSIKSIFGLFKKVFSTLFTEYKKHNSFKTSSAFNTPLLKDKNIIFDDDWVVIYPEITFGNPLKAKNVVRWLLHQPGFHTNAIFYGKGELLVKFNSAIDNFIFPGSVTSEQELKVIHYPLEHYNLDNVKEKREGTAYCLRKGANKEIQHDLVGSILIDNKSHAEISEIFKRVKTFVSYDTYTAYSLFAVLCGCESVVVPDDGISIDEWYPNVNDRNGIAYGFDDIERAKQTSGLVKKYVESEEAKSVNNVLAFIKDVDSYFVNHH